MKIGNDPVAVFGDENCNNVTGNMATRIFLGWTGLNREDAANRKIRESEDLPVERRRCMGVQLVQMVYWIKREIHGLIYFIPGIFVFGALENKREKLL